MDVATFLQLATAKLTTAGINTARLDALVLLSGIFGRDKAWVLAHDDETLTPAQESTLLTSLDRRAKREPLSYIRGFQEFYGHQFKVTPDVLIPRPDTEALVELLLGLPLQNNACIIDVGTGSGAIAVSIKLARPSFDVYATDISPAALAVARDNAQLLGAEITLEQSNLLSQMSTLRPNCIVSNLPYVDETWKRSAETNYEPGLALFAQDKGLELIKRLITQSKQALGTESFLLLEADPRQLGSIRSFAAANGFDACAASGYGMVFVRR
jgi:release factor glutamine methyltransferase